MVKMTVVVVVVNEVKKTAVEVKAIMVKVKVLVLVINVLKSNFWWLLPNW